MDGGLSVSFCPTSRVWIRWPMGTVPAVRTDARRGDRSRTGAKWGSWVSGKRWFKIGTTVSTSTTRSRFDHPGQPRLTGQSLAKCRCPTTGGAIATRATLGVDLLVALQATRDEKPGPLRFAAFTLPCRDTFPVAVAATGPFNCRPVSNSELSSAVTRDDADGSRFGLEIPDRPGFREFGLLRPGSRTIGDIDRNPSREVEPVALDDVAHLVSQPEANGM